MNLAKAGSPVRMNWALPAEPSQGFTYNLKSSLVSDQMSGSATSPPTTIPSKAVNTADPGTYTARR